MSTTDSDSAVILFEAAEETSPATMSSYDATRFNAMTHGILSRYVVLSHENANEYQDVLSSLVDEHRPKGTTEAHLVEELAGIIWRKQRVLQAEGAQINQGLKSAARDGRQVIPAAAPFEAGLSGEGTDLAELVGMNQEDLTDRVGEAQRGLETTAKASAILCRGGVNAYEKALRTLFPESREWWQECVEGNRYLANADGLALFICENLEPFFVDMEKSVRHREAVKTQLVGEGLQPHRFENLMRYETHLDRKFQRTLAMLLKLKELRVR